MQAAVSWQQNRADFLGNIESALFGIPSKPLKVAFGLTCCSRLVPYYVRFQAREGWGDVDCLKQILTELWNVDRSSVYSVTQLERLRDQCESRSPHVLLVVKGKPLQHPLRGQALCGAIISVLDYIRSSQIKDLITTSETTSDLAYAEAEADLEEHGRIPTRSAGNLFTMKAEYELIWFHSYVHRELNRQLSDAAELNDIGSSNDNRFDKFRERNLRIAEDGLAFDGH